LSFANRLLARAKLGLLAGVDVSKRWPADGWCERGPLFLLCCESRGAL